MAAARVSAPIDSNGNLASDGLTSYSWNARNQLIGISGGTSGSFAYDGEARRLSKTVSGTATNFLYGGNNVVQELSGTTPTANLLTGAIDETFTRTDGTGTSALLVDALGSTLALADTGGIVQTQYTYEPFGASTVSGSTSANASQFTGRENDLDGLYFYRARYYSPGVSRFVSEDPAGAQGGINLYGYADGDPVTLTDPFGLSPLDCALYLYWYGKCASSATECRKKLDLQYPDPVDMCIATNSNSPSEARYKICFANNPDCQKALYYGAKCSIFPTPTGLMTGLIDLIRRIFGR
jgi:RHS repeat-associated protein